jgi:hypothetical protein
MTRYLFAVAALCAVGLACRGADPTAAVKEAPPPAIEPELAAGSTLVDARADELMRAMSARLARATSFTVEAEEVYDEAPEQSPRQQLVSTRRVAVRRPDRFAGDAMGDAVNRSFVYDGRTLSVYDKEQNVWASGTVPPTIDGALDWAYDQTGTVVPLADFVYADPYARMMASVQRGVYLGIHDVAGVPCYHLSFEQAAIDWQIWIDAGRDPLPRKLVIAYKTEDEVPQYTATLRKWDFTSTVPDALFVFSPPATATRIEVPAMAAGTPAPKPADAQEKK